MIASVLMWLAWQRDKAKARHEAQRHLAAVARALYTGDTSAYTFTPDLPRQANSTEIEW